MRILLIRPLTYSLNPKKKSKGRPNFPIGIGYIASYLGENGFEVDVLDDEVECLDNKSLYERINGSDYDIYGITAMASQYSCIKELSRMIKTLKPNKLLVLGGQLSTYSYDLILKNSSVDICVIGEGEETIVDLINNIDECKKVPGIAYCDGKNVVKTPTRIFEKSRDEYPFPAYELFNMDPYLGKQLYSYDWDVPYLRNEMLILRDKHRGIKTIGLIAGIGCPYRCNFCAPSSGKMRLRPVDNIISEIQYCIDRFGIKGVKFLDELLIVNEERTLEFCEKIKPLDIYWSGQARSNVITERIVSAIKDAGCVGIGLGIETGSDRLLKAMNKAITVEQHKKAIQIIEKHDLAIKIQLLYGYPGENRKTVEETISFFKNVGVPPRRFNIIVPLPGSKLYNDAVEKGDIENEDEYLEKYSSGKYGFVSKQVMLNLTDMDDKEYIDLLCYAESTMESNYKADFRSMYGKRWVFKLFQGGAYKLSRKGKKAYRKVLAALTSITRKILIDDPVKSKSEKQVST